MDQIKTEELEQKINSQYGNTTGIVIIKDGIVSCEKYFKGCTAESNVVKLSADAWIKISLTQLALAPSETQRTLSS